MEIADIQGYRFMSSNPGIFVEIYLPKKAVFQGTLYDTLTDGFKVENIKSHLKDPVKAPRIKELLQGYERISNYTDEQIDGLPHLFFGYSMYEVEGVFYNDRKAEVQEEKTQVIRIMFRPNLKELFEKYPQGDRRMIVNTIKQYLRYPGGRELYRRDHEKVFESDPLQADIAKYMEQWEDSVALFLFGYLIYQICAKIVDLCSQGKMEWDKAEDEIWVTSFWNLVINPVKLMAKQ